MAESCVPPAPAGWSGSQLFRSSLECFGTLLFFLFPAKQSSAVRMERAPRRRLPAGDMDAAGPRLQSPPTSARDAGPSVAWLPAQQAAALRRSRAPSLRPSHPGPGLALPLVTPQQVTSGVVRFGVRATECCLSWHPLSRKLRASPQHRPVEPQVAPVARYPETLVPTPSAATRGIGPDRRPDGWPPPAAAPRPVPPIP
jgi:hypothetical protein